MYTHVVFLLQTLVLFQSVGGCSMEIQLKNMLQLMKLWEKLVVSRFEVGVTFKIIYKSECSDLSVVFRFFA